MCLLKRKGDVADCVKRFVAHVKNKFGRAPCVIKSDGGSECTSYELKRFYEQESIEAHYTVANSPQQNGVAKQQNRSLQEMATNMLLDAGLDKKYWGEAVATAAYLQNRLPSHYVDRTPFERWFGEKPTLTHLKVFGCPAFVHIPDVKRSKLDSKTQKLLFVGYCSDRKAYRFLDTETDTITICRDARFVELQEESPTFGGLPLAEEQLVEAEITSDRTKKQEVMSSPEQPEESEDESSDDSDGEQEQPDQTNVPEQGQKRSTRAVLRLEDYEVNAAMLVQENPVTYDVAMSGSEQELRKLAMAEEYQSLLDNRTWTLVELPEELPAGRTPIDWKWVYKKSVNDYGQANDRYTMAVTRTAQEEI